MSLLFCFSSLSLSVYMFYIFKTKIKTYGFRNQKLHLQCSSWTNKHIIARSNICTQSRLWWVITPRYHLKKTVEDWDLKTLPNVQLAACVRQLHILGAMSGTVMLPKNFIDWTFSWCRKVETYMETNLGRKLNRNKSGNDMFLPSSSWPNINGNCRILTWRYCTIQLSPYLRDIPLHMP